MVSWLDQALARDAIQDSLLAKREQSRHLLGNIPRPNRKTEAWKYTSLHALENLQLPTIAANEAAVDKEGVNNRGVEVIDNLATLDWVFVDGVLQSDLQQSLPAGVTIYPFNDKQINAQLFSTIKPTHHYFGLVNDVLANNGLFVDVAPNTIVEQPIRFVSLVTKSVETHLRLVVRVGDQAKVSFIEQAEGSNLSLNTFFSEYQLGSGAHVNHYRLAKQSDQTINFSGNHFLLAERAELDANIVAIGSRLSRLDVDVIHQGKYTKANLQGIYLLDKNEVFDLHTCVEHTVAHGQTEEIVRGIVGGAAKAVFNGRIHIHPDAQKTNAQLNNRNLLLSDKAEVDTKPELEIYADDVRCAHGATVAQMEERSLYYLQSRGISKEQAQAMLTFGFINELLTQMPHPAISDWLRPTIHQRLNIAFCRD